MTQSVILERMVKPEYQNAAEEDVDRDFAVHFTYRILSGLELMSLNGFDMQFWNSKKESLKPNEKLARDFAGNMFNLFAAQAFTVAALAGWSKGRDEVDENHQALFQNVCIYVCNVCMCLCMYVCMYVMYVCMCVCMYV